MNKKQLTITVAIPTCYGGKSLISTAESIYQSTEANINQFIIIADRTPIKPKIARALKKMGVSITWNNKEGSQFKKIKQSIEKTESDIYISTQDDITFDINCIKEIVRTFEQNPKITMLGIRIFPLPPVNFFESIMTTMVRLVDGISTSWNQGTNHLAASGRCLAFRTSHLKKFRIPGTVVNGDMFLYLENKRLRGRFKLARNAKVYIRCPQRLKDQIGPSSRYQFQNKELQNYFNFDISRGYKIPFQVLLSSFLKELMVHPITTISYLAVFAYTRIARQDKKTVSNPVWAVDSSTKNV